MSMNFTALDFETANFHRGSVCSVGVTAVRDGEITDTQSWHIYPPAGGTFFTNTWIHGITEDDVIGAPSWADTVKRLIELSEGTPLLAYSAFDKGVCNAASAASGVERALEMLDALAMARLHLPGLESYRLTAVAEHFELPDFVHHEPGADSRACAQIALALGQRTGHKTIEDLWQGVLDRRAESRRRGGNRQYAPSIKKGELPQPNPDADSTHPLFGHVVCFTGSIKSMSRNQAYNVAAQHGASLGINVTRETSILVVGDFDPATLRPGMKVSSKVQKAMTLAEKGQPLLIMTASDFIALVEEEP